MFHNAQKMTMPPLYRYLSRLANRICAGLIFASLLSASAAAQIATPPIAPQSERIKIGLLLPLSGQTAALGAAMQNAAIMALFAANNPNVAIIPYDTGGRAADAAIAAQKAVSEGANMILGPVFSAEIAAAAQSAPAIPVLSFSNDWTMAGKNVFIFGSTPQYDMAAVMPYLESRGVRMVHVLYAQNTYGKAVFDMVKNWTSNRAIALATDGGFNPQNPKSLRTAIEKIKSALPKNENDLNRYHAIIIGETGSRLMPINAAMADAGISAGDLPVAGTSQWADMDFTTMPQLLGAFYPAIDPRAGQQFVVRYQSYFGQNPPGLAIAAFDAVGMVAQFGDHWRDGRAMPITGGAVRFSTNQIAQRQLLMVNSNGGGILQN